MTELEQALKDVLASGLIPGDQHEEIRALVARILAGVNAHDALMSLIALLMVILKETIFETEYTMKNRPHRSVDEKVEARHALMRLCEICIKLNNHIKRSGIRDE